MITILTKIAGRYSPNNGGLPNHGVLDLMPTKEAAYEKAVAWVKDYEAADRFGNMAQVLGVIESADPPGWRGVVNYFHSNT